MKEEEIKKIIQESLMKVAPEVRFSDIDLKKPLRNQVEIDSYDLSNMLARIEIATKVRIPEAKIREIDNLSALIQFIADQKPRSGS